MENGYLKKLRQSCSMLYYELHSYVCSSVGLIKSKLFFRKDKTNKLEVGPGNAPRKAGFITSDLALRTDYPFDLRMGLPFPEESIDMIYAEHVFEHFSYRDLIFLLSDCYRVLKSGGRISLAVPDTRIWINAYCGSKELDLKKYCGYDTGLAYTSKIDYLNYIFYMDGHHRHMFDRDSLLTVLEASGFKDVHIRDFDPDLDQEVRKYASIYAEAFK